MILSLELEVATVLALGLETAVALELSLDWKSQNLLELVCSRYSTATARVADPIAPFQQSAIKN